MRNVVNLVKNCLKLFPAEATAHAPAKIQNNIQIIIKGQSKSKGFAANTDKIAAPNQAKAENTAKTKTQTPLDTTAAAHLEVQATAKRVAHVAITAQDKLQIQAKATAQCEAVNRPNRV